MAKNIFDSLLFFMRTFDGSKTLSNDNPEGITQDDIDRAFEALAAFEIKRKYNIPTKIEEPEPIKKHKIYRPFQK